MSETYPASRRILCAHADQDGAGMHWLEPGAVCPLTPPRPLTAARQEAEQRLLTGPQLEVRRTACPMCWAQSLTACQVYPRGDHLARWLACHEAGRITRAELAEVLALVVIVKASQVIPDAAVRAA